MERFGRLRRGTLPALAERAARFICDQKPQGNTYSVCVDKKHDVYVITTDDAEPAHIVGTYTVPAVWYHVAAEITTELKHHLTTLR